MIDPDAPGAGKFVRLRNLGDFDNVADSIITIDQWNVYKGMLAKKIGKGVDQDTISNDKWNVLIGDVHSRNLKRKRDEEIAKESTKKRKTGGGTTLYLVSSRL